MKSKISAYIEYIKKFTSNEKAIAVLSSAAAASAFVFLSHLKTSNPLILLIFIGCYFIFTRFKAESDTLTSTVSCTVALLFSLFLVFGNYSTLLDIADSKAWKIVFLFPVCILGSTLVFHRLIEASLVFLKDNALGKPSAVSLKPSFVFLYTFVLCFSVSSIYFIIMYPGVFTVDSIWQVKQILTGDYSNHHPWVHTMLIRLFFLIGRRFTDDINRCFGLFTFCQMIAMSALGGYVVTLMCKRRVNKIYLLFILLFFAFVPFNSMYYVTVWKDIPFAAVMMLFTMRLVRMIELQKNGELLKKDFIPLFFLSIFVCLLRSNGIFVFLACLPFIIFVFRKRLFSSIVCMALALVTVLTINGPVMTAYNVKSGDFIESLAVPCQHIARVITDGGKLTKEQYDLLSQVIDIDKIPESYLNFLADPIKLLVRQKDNQDFLVEHKAEFFKLWFDLGKKYPLMYVKAQVDITKGYWYPDFQYWVLTKEFGENDFDFYRPGIFGMEGVDRLLNFGNSYQKIPFYGLLWSIGSYTWVFIFLIALALIKKKNLLPFLPIAAMLGTIIIATPVCGEFRYVYSMILTVPVLFGLTVYPPPDKTQESTLEICENFE